MKSFEFTRLATPLGTTVRANGKQYLYFGGTAYLGIPQNQEFLELYVEGISRFGLNNGTSRNNNVQLGIYDEAESYAARKFGTKDALITSSGFLAAQITVSLVEKMGEVRYAPATHPALWPSENPGTTGTFPEWAEKVVSEINASTQTNWVLITNSMNNLVPEIFEFDFLKDILPSKSVILVLDDSHGIGINNNGLGVIPTVPELEHVQTLVVASMAKALGVDAGIVFGNGRLISELKHTPAFFGASPPSAAGLFAFINAEKIYEKELLSLKRNTTTLSDALKGNPDWHFVANFPVFLCKNLDISRKLKDRDILVSAFPYPDKNSDLVSRIVLTSKHQKEEILQLINALG